MLNTPPHLEARNPRGFISIFHGTSSSVARRRLRASDLSFWQSMPSFDIGRPGLHLQSGASVVLGGVGELPGSRCTDFNPRTRGGATRVHAFLIQQSRISIHAPRVGRDTTTGHPPKTAAQFQSTRPVWGATSARPTPASRRAEFQSTRPVWGATLIIFSVKAPLGISIHAPRVGRDQSMLHR